VTEKFISAVLVLIYAVGCAASAVEIHAQGERPSAKELRELRERPVLNVLAIVCMVAFWPLLVTWWKVREAWR
jgi:uncharacterized membrane protein